MTGLLAALLLAQAVQPENWINWTNYGTRGTSTVQVPLTLPLSSTGPLLPEDPGTVSHVYWDGSALVDTISNAWTMNGTVPQAAANVSPFVPGKPGAGPYSAANSYQGPTTLGEWTGDWSVTVVFKPGAVGALEVLASKMTTSVTEGWMIRRTAGGVWNLYLYDGVLRGAGAAGADTPGGINVVTAGKSGGTCYSRLNGGAAGSVACGTMTSAAAQAIRIGVLGTNGNPATTTTIYEILASTTPYSDALHAARFNAVFGLLPGPVTVTRADPITYTANGFVWSSPPATMGVGASGAEVWKGSTNYALNSAAHPKTAEATGSLNTGAHVAWHTGTGTMTVAAGTATVTGLACTAVSPGTNCTFTVTVAGTMAITTSAGTVTSIQVEPGAYPTPYIATTGTATARAATAASVPISTTLGNRLCVSGTFKPSETWTGPSTQRDLWGIGQAGAAGSWRLLTEVGLASFSMQHWDSAAAIKSYSYLHGLTGTGTARITACNNQGTFSVYIDGVQKTLIPVTITGTGLWTTNASTMYLGNYFNTSEFWDGAISGLKICKGATKASECR